MYEARIARLVKELKREKKKLDRLQEERKFVIDTLAQRVAEIRHKLYMLQLQAKSVVVFDLEEHSMDLKSPSPSASDRKGNRNKAHEEAVYSDTHLRAGARSRQQNPA